MLDTLTADPAVWSTTVFIITYDENDGFFDHVVPPTPPLDGKGGSSTVSTLNEHDPGSIGNPAGVYGPGVRVPCFIVSLWSKGGYVNSQLFDHTSLIRLPYEMHAYGVADADADAGTGTGTGTGAFAITFAATGAQTVVFLVRSADPLDEQRSYTVEPAQVARRHVDPGHRALRPVGDRPERLPAPLHGQHPGRWPRPPGAGDRRQGQPDDRPVPLSTATPQPWASS